MKRATGQDEVLLDFTHVREIEDRTDVDDHLPERQLREEVAAGAEDWGDGFFVDPEPVLVQRGPDGAIVRTTPLHELPGLDLNPDDEEPYEPEHAKHRTHSVLPTSEREKLAFVLANRLYKWYQQQPPRVDQYNPIYDGIPEMPANSDRALQPLPGTNLYLASPEQVFQWLYKVVGARVEIVNKKRGLKGHKTDLASDFSLRINRAPGGKKG